jgi:hypothetical protein
MRYVGANISADIPIFFPPLGRISPAPDPALHPTDGKQSAIVTARRRRMRFVNADMTADERRRRSDAADAFFRELVSRATGNDRPGGLSGAVAPFVIWSPSMRGEHSVRGVVQGSTWRATFVSGSPPEECGHQTICSKLLRQGAGTGIPPS